MHGRLRNDLLGATSLDRECPHALRLAIEFLESCLTASGIALFFPDGHRLYVDGKQVRRREAA
jgi:hypothetical protein